MSGSGAAAADDDEHRKVVMTYDIRLFWLLLLFERRDVFAAVQREAARGYRIDNWWQRVDCRQMNAINNAQQFIFST